MTPEQRADDLMLEWLETGPTRAPGRTIDLAVAYAETHPHSRFSVAGARRLAMTRLHLAGADARPQRHLPIPMAAGVAVVVLAVVAGGALLIRDRGDGDAGGVMPPVPTASPAPTPTPTPPPTVAPSPTAAPPISVTGSMHCTTTSAGLERVVGDVTQSRGVVLTCIPVMTDPRLAGDTVSHASIDMRVDESAEIWGTATITDAVGAWSGSWRGTVDAGYTTHRITGFYVGAGAYEGLRVRYTQVTDGDGYAFAGTIEAIGTTPPDGVTALLDSTCAVSANGTERAMGDITEYRDIVLSCPGASSDPRLAGMRRVTLNEDQRADESADMWGTFTIENERGSWTGEWTGTIDAGYTTHRTVGTIVGSGAYAGLVYEYTQVGTPESGYVMTGVIGPAS